MLLMIIDNYATGFHCEHKVTQKEANQVISWLSQSRMLDERVSVVLVEDPWKQSS